MINTNTMQLKTWKFICSQLQNKSPVALPFLNILDLSWLAEFTPTFDTNGGILNEYDCIHLMELLNEFFICIFNILLPFHNRISASEQTGSSKIQCKHWMKQTKQKTSYPCCTTSLINPCMLTYVASFLLL